MRRNGLIDNCDPHGEDWPCAAFSSSYLHIPNTIQTQLPKNANAPEPLPTPLYE